METSYSRTWSSIDEDAPDPEELAAINAYNDGDPDYQPSVSQSEMLKELGL